MCPVQCTRVCVQFAKPWPHSDIRFCCHQSAHVFTSRYDSILLHSFFTLKVILHEISRLAVVSCEANKKQHARASSSLRNHYSELLTQMAALRFENAVTQPL